MIVAEAIFADNEDQVLVRESLSAMPKTYHHFYLHRMVLRLNKYSSLCYALGRKPVQPRVRHVSDV